MEIWCSLNEFIPSGVELEANSHNPLVCETSEFLGSISRFTEHKNKMASGKMSLHESQSITLAVPPVV